PVRGGHATAGLTRTSDGGLLLVGGTTSSDGQVSGNHGKSDVWVVKLDANNQIQWQRALGGTGNDVGFSGLQTQDGNYVILGVTESADGDVKGIHPVLVSTKGLKTAEDTWLVKLDASGQNILWQRCIGGRRIDTAGAILEGADGSLVIAGETSSHDGDFKSNHGMGDAWVAKVSSNGNLLWAQTYGGSNRDFASSLAFTADGGLLVLGYTESPDQNGTACGYQGNGDILLLRLDATGKLLWNKCYGGCKKDQGASIVRARSGEFLVAGQTSSTDGHSTGNVFNLSSWLARMDEAGTVLGSKSFGGSGVQLIHNVIETSAGGLAFVGASDSKDGDIWSGARGGLDVWFGVLTADLNLKLSKTYGGKHADVGIALVETQPGKYSVAGFTSSTDGDVSGNHGSNDIWLMQLSE
ncbi:MAG: hypothetical protein WCI05_08630, partial [Myxococcales bacterium]